MHFGIQMMYAYMISQQGISYCWQCMESCFEIADVRDSVSLHDSSTGNLLLKKLESLGCYYTSVKKMAHWIA